jgi:hypothetical protein
MTSSIDLVGNSSWWVSQGADRWMEHVENLMDENWGHDLLETRFFLCFSEVSG